MDTDKRIKYLKLVSFVIIGLGVLVCLGWFLDIKVLQTIFTGYTSMKFNTAISLVLLGMSFYLSIVNRWSFVLKCLCAIVILIVLASFSQIVFDYQLGIDELVVKDYDAVFAGNPHPGRPSPASHYCLAAMAFGFIAIRAENKKLKITAQYAFHSVTLLSAIAIIGYLFNVPAFYNMSFISSVSLHGSASILLLSVAASLIYPRAGLTGMFTGEKIGSVMARRLFPQMLLALLVLGFLCISALRYKLLPAEFGIALYSTAFILISIFMVWNTFMKLNEVDAKRIEAEENSIKLNQELEEKVLKRTAELAESNKDMEAFSYSVSHDLRGPLRSISSYTQILEEDYSTVLDDDGKAYLSLISRTTLRLGTLIEDLLAFSRLGKQELKTTAVDMQALVNEVWEELQWLRAYKGQIKIHTLPGAHADPAMIKQVLINLLSNAIKYSSKKESPFIEIGAEQKEKEMVYFIKDNGAGFNMKYVTKLFTVFERLHNINDFEGTGVGLAIVKRIITKHGGKVWAEGEEGKGAIFYFTLPV